LRGALNAWRIKEEETAVLGGETLARVAQTGSKSGICGVKKYPPSPGLLKSICYVMDAIKISDFKEVMDPIRQASGIADHRAPFTCHEGSSCLWFCR
jgi:hypothetical protein